MAARNEIIELTSALIRYRSTASRPEELEGCAAHIMEWCEHEDIKCTRLENDGVPSLLIGPDSRKAPILFMAHFDVVDGPEGLFTPRHDGATLRGRGSIDDKYAVALSLVLFRDHLTALRARGGTQDDMPLQLLLTGDEETGGRNGAQFALGLVQAEFCIALDGGSPGTVITREKGVIDCTLTCTGKAAHGARPWLGVNAAELLMKDYAALKALFPDQDRDDPEHWHKSINLGIMRAGTTVNQVPDTATAWLDIRYTEHDSPDELIATMQDAVEGKIEVTRIEPVFYTGETPWLAELLGCSPETSTGLAHGASDARFLSEHGIPGVVWGAEGETSQHGPNEHLMLDSLDRLQTALATFINKAAAIAAAQEKRA